MHTIALWRNAFNQLFLTTAIRPRAIRRHTVAIASHVAIVDDVFVSGVARNVTHRWSVELTVDVQMARKGVVD